VERAQHRRQPLELGTQGALVQSRLAGEGRHAYQNEQRPLYSEKIPTRRSFLIESWIESWTHPRGGAMSDPKPETKNQAQDQLSEDQLEDVAGGTNFQNQDLMSAYNQAETLVVSSPKKKTAG
jgi:hypothetical protein